MNQPEHSSPRYGTIVFHGHRDADWLIVLGIGVFLLLLFLIFILDSAGSGMPFAVSILMIVMGIWKKNIDMLTCEADDFRTRLAPVAGWHTVLYSEVTRVEITPKILTVYYLKHNAPPDTAPTRIKIPLTQLEEADRPRCLETFRERLPASVFFE